jgi:hypothetical protein
MSQSEARKKHVEFSPLGKQCKEQMLQGDYQMPACQNATYQANVYDQYTISANYENLSTKAKQAAASTYAWLRHLGFDFVNENASNGNSNQVQAVISFAPNMRSANFSLDSPAASTQWINVPVASFAKHLAVHPDYDVVERLAFQATRGQYQRKLKQIHSITI